MPEVVKSFIENEDLKKVHDIQLSILNAYRNDISKHTSKNESVRIGQVLASMPSQLAKENKKFIYGVAKKGARAADFELAIQWLIDAGLIYKVPRVNKIAIPLKYYEDISAFKLFFLDIGLLCCMADIPASSLLIDFNNLSEFKGMVTEQYVAQQLISSSLTLFYWANDRTPAEIDFIAQSEGAIFPIEVKASTNVRGKSISKFTEENQNVHGIRYYLLGYKKQDRITNFPLYAVTFSTKQWF